MILTKRSWIVRTTPRAKELADELIERFEKEGDYDRVYVAFVEFKSAHDAEPRSSAALAGRQVPSAAAASGGDRCGCRQHAG